MATEKRLVKSIRFSPSEWRQLETWAREAGVPPARYVRRAALKKRPPAKPKATRQAAVREINRIGLTLQKLAGHRDGEAGDAIPQVLEELREALRKL